MTWDGKLSFWDNIIMTCHHKDKIWASSNNIITLKLVWSFRALRALMMSKWTIVHKWRYNVRLIVQSVTSWPSFSLENVSVWRRTAQTHLMLCFALLCEGPHWPVKTKYESFIHFLPLYPVRGRVGGWSLSQQDFYVLAHWPRDAQASRPIHGVHLGTVPGHPWSSRS